MEQTRPFVDLLLVDRLVQDLAQNYTLVGDDAHVSFDLDVAAGLLLLLPELVVLGFRTGLLVSRFVGLVSLGAPLVVLVLVVIAVSVVEVLVLGENGRVGGLSSCLIVALVEAGENDICELFGHELLVGLFHQGAWLRFDDADVVNST